MKEDYEYIKKWYGEHVARLCREIVPELFEEKTLVPRLLVACFAPHAELYQDMLTFGKYNIRNYMYTRLNRKEELFTSSKSATELLSEAGYRLFHCTRPEDINYFKSCYAEDELLCTFRDGVESRFKDSHYFFLVTQNYSSLRREDFPNPDRDDDYSKSVICLQIDRVGNSVRMTSRYNHSVDYADSMYSNNLDNIVPGLRYAFERDYNVKINHENNLAMSQLLGMNYVEYGPYRTLYKYNEMIDDKFYCPNNVVLYDNEAHIIPKDSSVLLDYYVIDYKNKKISTYDSEIPDFYHDKSFKKCEFYGGKEIDAYKIIFDDDSSVVLTSDKMGRIREIVDNSSTEIGDNFFSFCPYIKDVYTNRVQRIGNDFVMGSVELRYIDMPYVQEIGDNFISSNQNINYFQMDYLKSIGNNAFQSNKNVTMVEFPSLLYAGDYFFAQNDKIRVIDLPSAEYIGTESFGWCYDIDKINIPKLKDTGSECFFSDYNCQEYVNRVVMENFERGEINDMDMDEVSSLRHSR